MTIDEPVTAKQVYDRERYQRLKAERAALKPADPIALLPDSTLAYLAGLTDADGSIYVTSTNRLRTFYPNVCWAMTHKATIEWVAETLSGNKVMLHNSTNLRRGVTNQGVTTRREQWRTAVAGSRAQLLCQRMLPFMHTKAEQAKLVVDFPVDARSAPGIRLSDEVREQRIRLGQQISRLNRWRPEPAS